MLQQLEGEELIAGLYEVKSLLTAMNNVNERERQVRAQRKNTIPVQNVILLPAKKNRMKPLVILFLILLAMYTFSYGSNRASISEDAYSAAVTNDKFAWEMQHSEDEPYPGYDGPVDEPMGFIMACVRSLPIAGTVSAVFTAVVGAVIFTFRKHKNVSIDRENWRRTQKYRADIEQNNQIIAYNRKIDAEIEEFHARKQHISKEYLSNLGQWFPEEYAFMEAVEYFIRELELGTVSNLPEAIKSFREYKFRRKVIDNQQAMIDNQGIMILRQEEMIRQQMLGNFIAASTLNETRRMSDTLKDVEKNTEETAYYAKETAEASWRTVKDS